MEEKKKKKSGIYSAGNLSAFCLQVSLLLSSAVPLDEGLSVMAEDARTQEEKKLLQGLAEDVELGEPLFSALERTGEFPSYVVKMAKLGHQTGTLDQMMKDLSVYYEKEFQLMRSIQNALTYPVIMVFMLLTVLFVLFTKVMPVFEGVYEQLGAQMSPLSQTAIRFGGIFSGGALILSGIAAAAALAVWTASRFGKTFRLAEKLTESMKRRSRLALAVAGRRFTSVLALTLRSGMELEKGMELAGELVENSLVEEKLKECAEDLECGAGYYEAMKKTGLFSGFHIQMIRVGARSGSLDQVMEKLSDDYEKEAETAIDTMVARFEPTMVAVLAVAVGLVLLSVMLPLAGVAMRKKCDFKMWFSLTGSVAVVLAAAALMTAGVSQLSRRTEEEGARNLVQAVRRASVQCYAIEGRYPPSVEYLEENYGIAIDRERYHVFYEGFASNIMPDITVFPVSELEEQGE